MNRFENKRILIADDEAQMLELISAYLEKSNLIVDEAIDGNEALVKFNNNSYDCIILDVMMPEKDGLSTCLEMRKKSDVPIILLTARGDELDRVHGLELGADDYIVKPFSPRELVARVKALLRRSQVTQTFENNSGGVRTFGAITINEKSRKVSLDNEELDLTPKEYDLLYFLTKHPNQVWTREQILQNVWGYDFYGSLRTVDTHIKTLRMKIGDYSHYISTIWGVGYKFEVQ